MTVVDLFCGAGGASLGLKLAGLEVVQAIDNDGPALDAHRAAHPTVWHRQADVATLDQAGVLSAAGWWASPPCQPFSSAGRLLQGADPRDGWPHLLRLLRDAQAAGRAPRWLVCENVAGMTNKRGRPYLDRLVAELRELGPVDWRVLDAADYGVPQRRRRVFIRWGEAASWSWPEPTHEDPKTLDATSGRRRWATMRDALPHLDARFVGGGSNPHYPGEARTERDLTDEPSTTIAGPAGNAAPDVVTPIKGRGKLPQSMRDLHPDETPPTIDCGATGGSYRAPSTRPDWWHRSSNPDGPRRTVGTKANASVTLDRPSPAVSATEEKGTGNRAQRASRGEDMGTFGMDRASDLALLAAGRRRLTVPECAVLQGFPADYPFRGTKQQQYRQVGNACPPQLVAAIMSTRG